MKYPKLTGICERAIKNNLCNGCQKLEDINFKGQEQCGFVQKPIEKIKVILGIQEKMNI